MEGIKDVKSDGSLGDEREKGVVFIDLTLMITMLLGLSTLKVRPVQFRAIVQQESKVFAPRIVEDIMFRSSMKALIGGKKVLFKWNCGANIVIISMTSSHWYALVLRCQCKSFAKQLKSNWNEKRTIS